ncbi:unnamed protein product, partial [Phaeothamnion confervicola]
GSETNRSVISPAGDLDGDGYDDLLVSVTKQSSMDKQGVYVIFGRADWSTSASTAADAGLIGEYFVLPAGVDVTSLNQVDFNALTPKYTRTDAKVSFPATSGPGFAGFSDLNDRFAVRWTGQINIELGGTYKFFLASDDGSKLFIDGNQVINNDGLHGTSELSGSVNLSAGFHNIRVEMFENLGAASATLSWQKPGSVSREVIPSSV